MNHADTRKRMFHALETTKTKVLRQKMHVSKEKQKARMIEA